VLHHSVTFHITLTVHLCCPFSSNANQQSFSRTLTWFRDGDTVCFLGGRDHIPKWLSAVGRNIALRVRGWHLCPVPYFLTTQVVILSKNYSITCMHYSHSSVEDPLQECVKAQAMDCVACGQHMKTVSAFCFRGQGVCRGSLCCLGGCVLITEIDFN
jgi:hypothetical protein